MTIDKSLAAIRSIRARFGVFQIPLPCRLVHIGSDDRANAEEHLLRKMNNESRWQPFSITNVGDLTSGPQRLIYIGMTKANSPTGSVSGAFGPLARDAGRLLLNEACLSWCRNGTLASEARSDLDRWIWFLFDVAWMAIPGTPLRAEKRVAYCGLGLPYDKLKLTLLLNIGKWSPKRPEVLQRWSNELPDWYYSDLKDAFRASVFALDVLEDQMIRGSMVPGEPHPKKYEEEDR